MRPRSSTPKQAPLIIPAGHVDLTGELEIPVQPAGVVVIAHGSGSSRHSPRNQYVSRHLLMAGLATLRFDLLTPEEVEGDRHDLRLRFDIPLLAGRIDAATDWLVGHGEVRGLPVGYFGASTGAAAALVAAAEHPQRVAAVVSRGGRPDLASRWLTRVYCPTLLIVGGEDHRVLEYNEMARDLIPGPCELHVVPGATHLFEEPGALEKVARVSAAFLRENLIQAAPPAPHRHHHV